MISLIQQKASYPEGEHENTTNRWHKLVYENGIGRMAIIFDTFAYLLIIGTFLTTLGLMVKQEQKDVTSAYTFDDNYTGYRGRFEATYSSVGYD